MTAFYHHNAIDESDLSLVPLSHEDGTANGVDVDPVEELSDD